MKQNKELQQGTDLSVRSLSLSRRYPNLAKYLDDSIEYTSHGEEFVYGGQRFLLVTQGGEFEAGQILFVWDGSKFVFEKSDTTISLDLPSREREIGTDEKDIRGSADVIGQKKFYSYQLSQVEKFSSASGPDGGNLACVWSIRHLGRNENALNRWVTYTDSTAVFSRELHNHFGRSYNENEVEEGGIIISPTKISQEGKVRHGHVGILGTKDSDKKKRTIFSNSSRRSLWVQSHSLESWENYYKNKKGLDVLFYPIPAA